MPMQYPGLPDHESKFSQHVKRSCGDVTNHNLNKHSFTHQ